MPSFCPRHRLWWVLGHCLRAARGLVCLGADLTNFACAGTKSGCLVSHLYLPEVRLDCETPVLLRGRGSQGQGGDPLPVVGAVLLRAGPTGPAATSCFTVRSPVHSQWT